jgi:hypothetical protein
MMNEVLKVDFWKTAGKVAIGGGLVYGLLLALGKTDILKPITSRFSADGANGTAGVNEKGDVVLGTNRVYQIPVNSGGTSMPVITPLAEPVSGSGQYVGQTAYPMAAQNNLEMLIDGASWMNAAAYTNAAFGQNYSGSAVGNE